MKMVAGLWWIVTALICSADAAAQTSQYSDDVEKAQQESAETGKPIFAMAVRDTCPNCQAMAKRIQEDRQIQQLLGMYVVLRLDIDGAPYQEWRKQIPPEGNTLPIVFTVRADNSPMFAKSSTLPEDEFPRLLLDSIQQGGAVITPKQAELLDQATAEAKAALAAGNIDELAKVAKKARKVTHDKPMCFARAVLEFQQVFQPMIDDAKSKLEAVTKVTESKDVLPEALVGPIVAYAEAVDKLEDLELLGAEIKASDKKVNSHRTAKPLLAEARKLVAIAKAKKRTAAQTQTLNAIVAKHPADELGQRAQQLLADVKN